MFLFTGFNGFGQFGNAENKRTTYKEVRRCDVLVNNNGADVDVLRNDKFSQTDISDKPDTDDSNENVLIAPSWRYTAFACGSQLWLRGLLCRERNEVLNIQTPDVIWRLAVCDKYCLVLLANGQLYKIESKLKATLQLITLEEVPEKLTFPLKRTVSGSPKRHPSTDGVNKIKITHVACGSHIAAAVSSTNVIYSIPCVLHQLEHHRQVIQLVCGFEHAILLDANGDLFTWGNGLRGQLGHYTMDIHEKPLQVEALAGIRIVHIAAGGWHSAAISVYGDLYTWGSNSNGQLGLFVRKLNSLYVPTVYPKPQVQEEMYCCRKVGLAYVPNHSYPDATSNEATVETTTSAAAAVPPGPNAAAVETGSADAAVDITSADGTVATTSADVADDISTADGTVASTSTAAVLANTSADEAVDITTADGTVATTTSADATIDLNIAYEAVDITTADGTVPITSADTEVATTSAAAALATTIIDAEVATTSADVADDITTADGSVTTTSAAAALANISADEAVDITTADGTVATTTSADATIDITTADGTVASTSAAAALANTSADEAVDITTADGTVASTSAAAALANTSADEAVDITTADGTVASTSAFAPLPTSRYPLVTIGCAPHRVFAGARHTLVRMTCGNLWAVGWSKHGQLGIHVHESCCDDFLLVHVPTDRFRDVICGPWCTVLVK